LFWEAFNFYRIEIIPSSALIASLRTGSKSTRLRRGIRSRLARVDFGLRAWLTG
jgi:hypothetical protein